MNNNHTRMLRSLCPDIRFDELDSSSVWKARAASILAAATHHRELYPVLDHTRGSGPYVYDLEGRKYFDLTSGIAVRAFGVLPERQQAFEASIQNVVRNAYGHGFDTIPQVLLAERLASITPGDFPKQVFFTTSGARAVESAVKSAMDRTGRTRVVAFRPSFHGRTGYALALTASSHVHQNGFPRGLDVVRGMYPNVYRCPFDLTQDSVSGHYLKVLKQAIDMEGQDIAAIVFEPIAGESGFMVPPSDFVRGLRALADEYGALLIADEVQTGMGRTGRWWAVEHAGVVPDYICTSKAFGGQYSLGAAVGPAPMFSTRARHSETMAAEPYKALVSLFVLSEVERHLGHVSDIGAYFFEGLMRLSAAHESIGDVRGVGLLLAIEFVSDRGTKEPASDLAREIIRECIETQRLWVVEAGESSIRLTPHYSITRTEVDMVLERLSAAILAIEERISQAVPV